MKMNALGSVTRQWIAAACVLLVLVVAGILNRQFGSSSEGGPEPTASADSVSSAIDTAPLGSSSSTNTAKDPPVQPVIVKTIGTWVRHMSVAEHNVYFTSKGTVWKGDAREGGAPTKELELEGYVNRVVPLGDRIYFDCARKSDDWREQSRSRKLCSATLDGEDVQQHVAMSGGDDLATDGERLYWTQKNRIWSFQPGGKRMRPKGSAVDFEAVSAGHGAVYWCDDTEPLEDGVLRSTRSKKELAQPYSCKRFIAAAPGGVYVTGNSIGAERPSLSVRFYALDGTKRKIVSDTYEEMDGLAADERGAYWVNSTRNGVYFYDAASESTKRVARACKRRTTGDRFDIAVGKLHLCWAVYTKGDSTVQCVSKDALAGAGGSAPDLPTVEVRRYTSIDDVCAAEGEQGFVVSGPASTPTDQLEATLAKNHNLVSCTFFKAGKACCGRRVR